MRRIWWGIAAASLLLIAPADAGKHGWYVALESGQSDISIDGHVLVQPGGILGLDLIAPLGEADESITFLGTLAGHISKDFRIEAEVGLRSADIPTGDATQLTLMLNAAYDIPIMDALSLTLGVGGGIDSVSVDAWNARESGVMLAFQGLAGLAYEVSDGVELVLNYRYFRAIGPEFGEIPPTSFGGPGPFVAPVHGLEVESADDTTISLGLRFDL